MMNPSNNDYWVVPVARRGAREAAALASSLGQGGDPDRRVVGEARRHQGLGSPGASRGGQ